ncbi:hypothetical protein ASPWEDRAFT_65603 [Aspergillus wentii DTO 134E9]|uniref:Gryzun putative trafficking through Golgi domain-containing protein n=1 Tax=Aspergillus wentii DTO 134E9 TaxID=1073089 RepID=A0A1L9RUJ5_ASPWE|nr:uncharacterized protein ASPWEDRAFT_65603 [Aspergillus wentii DTO 134E9]OJJ38602.1 hypothetical protein ASPWEDRAFT_65603 [Aspergillus wentii DTO 134E9]
MDAYPEDYVVHNTPLVLLSGLEADTTDEPESCDADYPFFERGAKIYSDFPSLSGAAAEELRSVLLEEDTSQVPWNPREDNQTRSTGVGFKIKSVGRTYRLPPRKADPPPVSPPTSPTDGQDDDAPRLSFVLHSPISPLTPSSPTFPDGLVTPLWVEKHQKLVPAAVINFFPFSLDHNMSSLRDNQLKIEINGLKKEWSSSGYKTRFLVVLLSEEGDILEDADDRLASIRRATNLDPRSIMLLPSDSTRSELKGFAGSLFSFLQPSVVEYYRDLSKHARRKRNRSSIPPPTAPPTSGTSQTLSLQGWNVRYEFKLGIFAEFRQEMDAALRNYESAYETLFGQEVFENIAGWNPRFNDARLLADSLAMRIIRCLFWAGQTMAAVRSWVNHRSRCQDILNRRGKGSRNYGWEAWESRWSMVMAQLIHRAEIPFFCAPDAHHSIFIPRDRLLPTVDGIYPWEQLHHEGYWLYRSAKHSILRRKLAQQIPDEDRMPPGQSPASQIASKSYLYDTYLAPETHVEAPLAGMTGFDHSHLILCTLRAALAEFSKRDQTRKVESLSLEIAEEYIRIGSWSDGLETLRPLWSALSWRRSGWWPLMEKFARALRECAVKAQDSETILRVDWELLNKAFPARPDGYYDIHKSLKDLPLEKPKPSVVLKAEDVISSLAASFIFEKSEGNVGEPLQVQLVITSSAQPSSGPIKLSEVKVVFEGCLRPVKLQSDRNADADITTPCVMSSPSLREPSTNSSSLQSPTSGLGSLIGIADLTIGPSQTKVFNLACIPREAGEARVASTTMLVEEEAFDLACVTTDQSQRETFWWQQTQKGASRRRVGKGRDTTRCKIMPKPPKIRITTPDLKETYYTNERIILTLGIHNDEDEAADVSAEARLFGRPESATKILWLDEENNTDTHDSGQSSPTEGASHFVKRPLGIMEASSKQELVIVLADTNDASDYEIEISAVYNLVSDTQTPIIKTVTAGLSIIRPFEANYEFVPRLHPHPWPDFFQVDDGLIGDESDHTKSWGLQQKWCLNSKVVSFALEPLVIEKMSLVLLGLGGGAVCQIGPEMVVNPDAAEIGPEELRESNFILDIQKVILGDRRPTSLNMALDVHWRRRDNGGATSESSADSCSVTTSLAIPRFVVPTGEPRVLASARPSETLSGLIHLNYTLENPSMHFLTFNLTMEASEYFAFSGPKTMVVQLVPLSRHTVRYNLLASKRGLWIQPQLVVVDTYFNKNLRILPTEEMRSDKKGILVWVDADD